MPGLPCPDPNLPAGLTQRDIDRACGRFVEDSERYERELEKADRWMDEAQDRRAEEAFDRNHNNT